jgi:PEP-CTERM motif
MQIHAGRANQRIIHALSAAGQRRRGFVLHPEMRTMTQFSVTSRRPAFSSAMIVLCCLAALLAGGNTARATVLYNNDDPSTLMAAASRPATAANGNVEIEAADDFLFTQPTRIDGATFTGLLPSGSALSSVNDVAVEIYRVFPNDSGTFDSRVPTRTNSPSDNALLGRDSANAGELTFTSAILFGGDITTNNSVLNGINPSPNQTTGGEGSVTGERVRFTLTFPGGITLPADHYFFKPEVGLTSGQFYWLSANRPYTGVGSFAPDLQAWIRNTSLDPDWLRIGTDIVGGATPPTFNMAFSLSGAVVPEPTSILLMAIGGAAVLIVRYIARRRAF